MKNPHPYSAASRKLDAAAKHYQAAIDAHTLAHYGQGSDTTTAQHARAAIRALQQYLDETSQPRSTPEEEQAETQLEQAEREHETAKADAHQAIAARAAAEVEADRAHNATAEALRNARNASAKLQSTEDERIRTAYHYRRTQDAVEAAKKNAKAAAQ